MHRDVDLRIDEDVQRRIEALARERGCTPSELVRAAFDAFEAKQSGPQQNLSNEESVYDALKRTGLIGCIKGGPRDLSTDPEYLEGLGRD